ncbi:RDD family protein [Clostridium baratii]|uniref:RDD family protein n=1 Tax=Clostridium baratii TaxID=1561 RepID=UPI00290885A8|nr:RDD family protein [Clostridium baratii]MDU4910042.1 RDD family protein [Clostridium baratii]
MSKKDENTIKDLLNGEELEKEILEEELEVDSNPSFFKKLFASLLDQVILIGVSALLLVIFDLIIGFMGYMVVEPTGIILIIYGILNVLYRPIFEGKNKRTIGKRILAIK